MSRPMGPWAHGLMGPMGPWPMTHGPWAPGPMAPGPMALLFGPMGPRPIGPLYGGSGPIIPLLFFYMPYRGPFMCPSLMGHMNGLGPGVKDK